MNQPIMNYLSESESTQGWIVFAFIFFMFAFWSLAMFYMNNICEFKKAKRKIFSNET